MRFRDEEEERRRSGPERALFTRLPFQTLPVNPGELNDFPQTLIQEGKRCPKKQFRKLTQIFHLSSVESISQDMFGVRNLVFCTSYGSNGNLGAAGSFGVLGDHWERFSAGDWNAGSSNFRAYRKPNLGEI